MLQNAWDVIFCDTPIKDVMETEPKLVFRFSFILGCIR